MSSANEDIDKLGSGAASMFVWIWAPAGIKLDKEMMKKQEMKIVLNGLVILHIFF